MNDIGMQARAAIDFDKAMETAKSYLPKDDSLPECNLARAFMARDMQKAQLMHHIKMRQPPEDINDISLETMSHINKRVQARFDFLMQEAKHGHWETMFRCVHEELKIQRDAFNKLTTR